MTSENSFRTIDSALDFSYRISCFSVCHFRFVFVIGKTGLDFFHTDCFGNMHSSDATMPWICFCMSFECWRKMSVSVCMSTCVCADSYEIWLQHIFFFFCFVGEAPYVIQLCVRANSFVYFKSTAVCTRSLKFNF